MKTKITLGLAVLVAACSTPQKQEASTTESTEPVVSVIGVPVDYQADSTTMNGYLAYDENDSSKRPGILVVHEWWGHNSHARERADMLAELGYVALAVDMYGEGKQAAHPGEAGEFAGMVMSNFDGAKARFESAINVLKDNPNVDPDKIGAIGFCFGGSVVLSMANSGYDLDAVTAFHSGLQLPVFPDSGAVKGKILVLNGAADPFVPEAQVDNFKAMLDSAGTDYKYIGYEGVVHAFTNKGADSIANQFEPLKGALAYNAEADSASWEEMKALFAEVF